ncbi:flagellin [Brevundimonas sp.]|uniref:flagellin n=1 Tax=Brevundimonas sp. TaxID=1871086 RepID=UPI003A8F151A
MTRVSTAGNYHSALADLMSTQVRAQEAQTRISTQKVATDLTGFGRGSETLTALKSMQSRIEGFINTGETVSARLAAQDLAFDRVTSGASGGRQAIAEALASGRIDGLMQQLQNNFQVAQDGMNTKHQGRYLFAGGSVETVPVVSMTMADLAAAPSVADSFVNDSLKQTSRLDESSRMETTFLADEIGTDLFQIFRDIQIYHGTTPITDPMSDVTRDFLTTQLQRFDTARVKITDMAARNGAMQNRVDTILKSQEAQQTSLDQLLSTKTDADMAQAITDLQLSQVAIQASAQVINQLRQVSLLNYIS